MALPNLQPTKNLNFLNTYKPTPVRGPIISGCEGPKERLSNFADKLLQPNAQQHTSYLKNTMDFINFQSPSWHYLSIFGYYKLLHTTRWRNYNSMQSIRTIPQLQPSYPIPILLKYALSHTPRKFFPVLWEQFSPDPCNRIRYQNGSCLCQYLHGPHWGIIQQSKTKPREWKLYIDNIFSLWDSPKQEIYLFIEQANKFCPPIKFTAEISQIETTFLDTIIY